MVTGEVTTAGLESEDLHVNRGAATLSLFFLAPVPENIRNAASGTEETQTEGGGGSHDGGLHMLHRLQHQPRHTQNGVYTQCLASQTDGRHLNGTGSLVQR